MVPRMQAVVAPSHKTLVVPSVKDSVGHNGSCRVIVHVKRKVISFPFENFLRDLCVFIALWSHCHCSRRSRRKEHLSLYIDQSYVNCQENVKRKFELSSHGPLAAL